MSVALLARQVVRAAQQAPGRITLLTAPTPGCGRRTLFDRLGPAAAVAGLTLVDARKAMALGPDEVEGERLLVLAPPLDDPAAWAELPQAWWAAAEGAVLVVMGRRTPRAELVTAKETLAAHGIDLVGAVYNQHVEASLWPPWAPLARALRRRRRKRAAAPKVIP